MPRVSLESQPFITGLEISPAESEKPASVAINGGIVASDRAWSSELLVDGQLVKIVRSLEGPDELDNRVAIPAVTSSCFHPFAWISGVRRKKQAKQKGCCGLIACGN